MDIECETYTRADDAAVWIGESFDAWRQSPRTYIDPTRKVNVKPIFLVRLICIFHRTGNGMIRIPRSLATCGKLIQAPSTW